MTNPQPIPEQAQDVVTALRTQVDALTAELERLRAIGNSTSAVERLKDDVVRRAQEADNCLDEGDTVALHCTGGACLYELHWALARFTAAIDTNERTPQ